MAGRDRRRLSRGAGSWVRSGGDVPFITVGRVPELGERGLDGLTMPTWTSIAGPGLPIL